MLYYSRLFDMCFTYLHFAYRLLYGRVHTDPGKSWWKVMEFKIQIFQAWKVMESGLGPGKSWKVHIKGPRKSWKTTVSVVYPPCYLFSCILFLLYSVLTVRIVTVLIDWLSRGLLKQTAMLCFCARQHICYSAYMLSPVRPSVRPSHGWISQKRLKIGSCNFTTRYPHDSSFLTVNFTPKFQGEHRERGRQIREG